MERQEYAAVDDMLTEMELHIRVCRENRSLSKTAIQETTRNIDLRRGNFTMELLALQARVFFERIDYERVKTIYNEAMSVYHCGNKSTQCAVIAGKELAHLPLLY